MAEAGADWGRSESLGGDTKFTVSHVAGYGNGWIPVLDGDLDLVARIPDVRRDFEARGVTSAPVSVAYGYNREVRDTELERLEAAGVQRIFLAVDALPHGLSTPTRRCCIGPFAADWSSSE